MFNGIQIMHVKQTEMLLLGATKDIIDIRDSKTKRWAVIDYSVINDIILIFDLSLYIYTYYI